MSLPTLIGFVLFLVAAGAVAAFAYHAFVWLVSL